MNTAALLFLLASAGAADTWSQPHAGLSLLERIETGSDPQRIHAAYVSLCEPGLHPRATRYEERSQTTSAWAGSVGAFVAINGAFFSYDDYDAIGWSMGDGESWPTASDYEGYSAVAFASYARADIFDTDVPLPPDDQPWWREMVPGWPLLVDDGELVDNDCESHLCYDNPRTAVGLTEDGSTAILVTVDGRSDSAAGMTTAELAELMLELGAFRAINLDGGGSTTMYVEGLGVVNDPSDGSERVVASHLGFLDVDGEEPCCLYESVDGATGVFGDIPDDSWVLGYAEALYQAGITDGCQQDPLLFCPDCVLDRAHAGVLVARGLGLQEQDSASFSDVDPDEWYAGWIEALYQAGITTGCGDGIYCPDRLTTRYEAAVFVFRGMGLESTQPQGQFFDLSDDQAAIVEALVQACVVSGCGDGIFCPDQEITRGEIAKLIAVGFGIGDYGPCLDTDSGQWGDTDHGTGGQADTGSGSIAAPGELHVTESQGCGCQSAPGGGAPAVAGLALAMLLALSGRRQQQSP